MTVSVKRDGKTGVEITAADHRSFYRVTEDVSQMRAVWAHLGDVIREIDADQAAE